ncbi:AIPR family protein [Bacillus haynesii]|uniref:AIPR family protein n=1 Tax=Bacillus haynesii TaxID=1925021 RepID=UPI00227E957D|nr:AIPR family protein [Bacillus haynesii]MCY7754986.1 AIPR family protein [Bacillus haynesii]
MDKELIRFAYDFQQYILTETEINNLNDENINEKEGRFTEFMITSLIGDGALEDGIVCPYQSHGIKINGYAVSEANDRLDLFVSHFTGVAPPQTVYKAIVNKEIKRLLNFLRKCLNDVFQLKEEEQNEPIKDLIDYIKGMKKKVRKINLFFFTDGIIKKDPIEDEYIEDIEVTFNLWDLERLHRSLTSKESMEAIEIDFSLESQVVPCLKMMGSNDDYDSYLAIFPGELLVKIYDEYGPRLLERNVRSFLQAKSKANKGIRDTIKEEPHMFFAYNNGLSAVAQKIETVKLPNGQLIITKAIDLQIVNGGQTTASIHHAYKTEKLTLKQLTVQAKITVIKNTEKNEVMIPKISQYANTQNNIQAADFLANDPFHRKLEQLSRTIWAPPKKGNQEQTKWYYERARGQYLVDRGKEHTLSFKRKFDNLNPKSQKFTKTDLAKYENTWELLPHTVSKGAQKNFGEFTSRINEEKIEPDSNYYKEIIARAIIFKTAEKLVHAQKYGGYRANIVTYTLAWIFKFCDQSIDLKRIWKEQSISKEFEAAIINVSHYAYDHIINVPNGGNVTEWCKKKECWDTFKNTKIDLSKEFLKQLVSD